ncbi:MAG: trypsin-like serine protease, partial [Pseudobdellovibrionaceae bacterium]|nr:trypsin-like serine protease [Pseudobdellovibrionaceae bacterium]
MIPVAALIFLISCGEAKKVEEESGLSVVGGERVSSGLYDKYFTSIVSMQFGGRHFCGGTLIASNKVLSAAHCLADQNRQLVLNNLQITIGTEDLGNLQGAQRFGIVAY